MKPVYKVWERLIDVAPVATQSYEVSIPFPVCLLESYRFAFISGDTLNVGISIFLNGSVERNLYYENDEIKIMKDLKSGDKILVRVDNSGITSTSLVVTLNISKMEE